MKNNHIKTKNISTIKARTQLSLTAKINEFNTQNQRWSFSPQDRIKNPTKH